MCVLLFFCKDPKIKAALKKHLLSASGEGDNRTKGAIGHLNCNRNRPGPAVHQSHARTNGSCPSPEQEPLLHDNEENNGRLHWEPLSAANNDNSKRGQPKFEAYMMTGEHILNISRMPQTANILPKQQKKVNKEPVTNRA